MLTRQNPLEAYWKPVKHILRCLPGTLDNGINLKKINPNDLNVVGFCDADWASDL